MEKDVVFRHIDDFIEIADSNRFKLWAIVGKEPKKKKDIIDYLVRQGWTLIDVSKELSIEMPEDIEEVPHNIGLKVKEWFNSKPNKLILTNAAILYHQSFQKLGPLGAFKYNSRNKNCVLFLENEHMISNRLTYGKPGSDDYVTQDVYNIVLSKFEEIKEEYTPIKKERKIVKKDDLKEGAIGKLFNYTPIKDVIDIDLDLRDEKSKKNLISSFIISDYLEKQLIPLYEDLDKPKHKAIKIVGNYGSGKSHLIGFLITSILNKELRDLIKNEKIREIAKQVNRNFLIVQFELSGKADFSTWFFNETKKQLNEKYSIDIPEFTEKDYNPKENILKIIRKVKENNPDNALMIVVDELSDFLQSKQTYQINQDLQFIRVVGQVCNDQDFLFITSMQEDIYTSPKFKTIGKSESRISERFLDIIIHKEDINRVISERIVPKSSEQRIQLSKEMKSFAEKITDVSNNVDEYIELFPFTPSLLDLFDDLPYFENRGVIQFAQSELRYILNEPFPFFFTFEKVFDLLIKDPNKANLEEVYNVSSAVNKVMQKVKYNVDEKFREDAVRIIKALAIYSLWSGGKDGATSHELAEKLLIIPENKKIDSHDYVAQIILQIRKATDNFYIVHKKDEQTGHSYFKFDPAEIGADPEDKIENEKNAVSDDQIERELFHQINEILILEPFLNVPDVFEDEASWQSVKSFRKGFVVFFRKGSVIDHLPVRDYVIAIISPFRKEEVPVISNNQLNIKINIPDQSYLETLLRIAAIRQLLEKRILTGPLNKRLGDTITGYEKDGVRVSGIKYQIARWFYTVSECTHNEKHISVSSLIGKEINNLYEIVNELKIKVFDKRFNDLYPEHPKYSNQLSSDNIISSLNDIASQLADGDFQFSIHAANFLHSINLLNNQDYPDPTKSKIALKILGMIDKNGDKVTDIKKDLIEDLRKSPFGLEPEIVHLMLVLFTSIGKICLKVVGGKTIDITNIKSDLKSLTAFENIPYALKKKEFSFDFAARLMNILGLNSTKILNESTRNEAFREYLEKVNEIIKMIDETANLIDKISSKFSVDIDINKINDAFNNILEFNFKQLQILNIAHFSSIEHLNDKLEDIKSLVSLLFSINETCKLYHDVIYDDINYMKKALEIVNENKKHVNKKTTISKLDEHFKDTIKIVKDNNLIVQNEYRRTLPGKIKQFKKIYIEEFYFPAHNVTVGKDVNWSALENLNQNKIYQEIKILTNIEYTPIGKFRKKEDTWNQIIDLKCERLDIDRLNTLPFCSHCSFMNNDKSYDHIHTAVDKVEEDLKKILSDFHKTAVKNITQNIGNMDLVDIPAELKSIIDEIVKNKKLPAKLDFSAIAFINKLFKNFQTKEITKDEVLNILIPEDKWVTLEELKNNFNGLEEKLKGEDDPDTIRIKLKM